MTVDHFKISRRRRDRARRSQSTAWADTPRPSGEHCDKCGRVFAAGFLPTDGTLTCRDCRQSQHVEHDTLF